VTQTLVHLLRHGKVQNPHDILYGRLPGYPLAASGRAMAAGVADYLAGSDITYLAASSLQRAQQTAAPLAAAFGLQTATDDRIIEAANDFEGVTFGINRTLGSPRTWAKLRDPRTPSWGEPYLDIAHRMLAAIYTAVQAADGHQAVLVSHQLPIVTARRFLHGQRLWHDPRHRSCSVASLTTLAFADGIFTGSSYREPVAYIAAVNDPDPDVETFPGAAASGAAAPGANAPGASG
jgi:broad specificity phosphatase PhoE